MTIVCTVCGYDQNPDGAEFCDACGAELTVETTPSPPPTPPPTPPIPTPPPQPTPAAVDEVIDITPPEPMPIPSPSPPQIPTIPSPPAVPVAAATARLVAKQPNAPVPEFPIDGTAIIGIFDPDMGPVDVDLEDFLGSETVSRNHAEIYQDGGVWKIKDLGSTNGVFIKPVGQTRFGSRITSPEPLNPGDEVAIAKIRFLFQSP